MNKGELFTPIRDAIDGCWPGEWGVDPISDNSNCIVYRATDIDSDGHLNIEGGALRWVSQTKLLTKALKPFDILLEASGGAPEKPVGRVALFPGSSRGVSLTSNFFRYIRPAAGTDPRFLLLQLVALNRSSAIWRYQQQTTGLINLKVEGYLGHRIWFPGISIQEKVSEILFAIDEAIGKTEALIAKYQQIKTGLMHDLFTRGVLPNGQLRPPREQAPEMYQETAIGWIPRKWDFTTCFNVCEKIIDCKNRTPPESPDGFPVIRTPNVRDGEFVDAELMFTDKDSYEIWTARGKPQVGDILITREAPVGEVCSIPQRHQFTCLGQRMMLFRPNPELVEPRYFLYALQSRQIKNRLDLISGGSTVGHVRVGDIRNLYFFMPTSRKEQQQIFTTFDGIRGSLKHEIEYLDKLRHKKLGLMQDLLTGKVPVKVDVPEKAHA